MIMKIVMNRIRVHFSIQCPNSLLGLCKVWSNRKKNCPFLQTNTDCIDKDWALGIPNRNKCASTNKKWAFENIYKYLLGMQDIYIQCKPSHELLNVLLQNLMGWS